MCMTTCKIFKEHSIIKVSDILRSGNELASTGLIICQGKKEKTNGGTRYLVTPDLLQISLGDVEESL